MKLFRSECIHLFFGVSPQVISKPVFQSENKNAKYNAIKFNIGEDNEYVYRCKRWVNIKNENKIAMTTNNALIHAIKILSQSLAWKSDLGAMHFMAAMRQYILHARA